MTYLEKIRLIMDFRDFLCSDSQDNPFNNVDDCREVFNTALDAMRIQYGFCGNCIDHGGDYDCDHVHCRKGQSLWH